MALSNFLLSDKSYKTEIQNLIHELKISNVDSDPAILWDTIKACIHSHTIHYLCEAKINRKKKIEQVEAEVTQASFDRDAAQSEDMVKHYAAKVKFLQIELDDVFAAHHALAF